MHKLMSGEWLFFALIICVITILFFKNKRNKDLILLDIVLGLAIVFTNSFFVTLPEADGDAIYYVEVAQDIAEGVVCILCTSTIFSSRIISAFYSLLLEPFGVTTFTASLLNYSLSLASLTLFNLWFSRNSSSNSHRSALMILVLSPLALLYGSIPLRESLFSALFFFLFLVSIKINKKNWILTIPLFLVLAISTSLLHKIGAFFAIYLCFLYFSMTYLFLNNFRNSVLVNLALLLTILVAFPDQVARATQMGEIIYRVAVDSPSALNYPSWLVGGGPMAVVLLPIKLIYFLFSPFLFEISKVSHLILVIDAMIFVYIFFFLLFRSPPGAKFRRIYFGLMFVAIIFAFVSANSGTSSRHRNKLLLPFVFLYAVGREQNTVAEKLKASKSAIR